MVFSAAVPYPNLRGALETSLTFGPSPTGTKRVVIFGVVKCASDNSPVPGCIVGVHSGGGVLARAARRVVTNRAGAFAVDKALAPGNYTIELHNGGAVTQIPLVVKSAVGWCMVLHLRVKCGGSPAPRPVRRVARGVRLLGAITFPDGLVPPSSEIIVSAWRSEGSHPPRRVDGYGRCNASGAFVFSRGLAPGGYTLVAEMFSRKTQLVAVVASRSLLVGSSTPRCIVQRLKVFRGSLVGRVEDPSGKPAVSAYVVMRNTRNHLLVYSAPANGAGRYVVRYVAPGRYVVLANGVVRGRRRSYSEISSPVIVMVQGGRGTRNIRLRRAFRVGK